MLDLICHPATPTEVVQRLSVEVDNTVPGSLTLTYTLDGDIQELALPIDAEPVHTDGLWRHTCFEAFVHAPDGTAYTEFNFSPSGAWAAYSFTDFRQGMTPLEIAAPQIALTTSTQRLILSVRLTAPVLVVSAPLALTAVVEGKDGGQSFWALHHPTAEPNFHHVDGFRTRIG